MATRCRGQSSKDDELSAKVSEPIGEVSSRSENDDCGPLQPAREIDNATTGSHPHFIYWMPTLWSSQARMSFSPNAHWEYSSSRTRKVAFGMPVSLL